MTAQRDLVPGLAREWRQLLMPPGAGPVPARAALWAVPVALGMGVLWRRGTRLQRSYALAATCIVSVALLPPFRGWLLDAMSAFYVTRFAQALPVAAMAGLGVSVAWAPAASTLRARVAGAGVVGAIVAVLLGEIAPWSTAPPPEPLRAAAELRSLEPLLRDRIVLSDLRTAYVLPALAGPYVTWNETLHSNPWAYDPDRNRGARELVSGRAGPKRVRRYVERNAVDFAVLPIDAEAARRALVGSGAFRERLSGERYVVLEALR